MIRYAELSDFQYLKEVDRHLAEEELLQSILSHHVLVYFEKDVFVGWLRFNLFWDHIPFMNMLVILEGYRNQKRGTELVSFWEKEMKMKGYDLVLTSTQSNEQGQFFYRKNGYRDCGSMILDEEPEELFLMKKIR